MPKVSPNFAIARTMAGAKYVDAGPAFSCAGGYSPMTPLLYQARLFCQPLRPNFLSARTQVSKASVRNGSTAAVGGGRARLSRSVSRSWRRPKEGYRRRREFGGFILSWIVTGSAAP